MTRLQRALEVLAAAESTLRDLMAESLGEHAYSEVGELAAFAEGITGLLKGRDISLKPDLAQLQRPGTETPRPQMSAIAAVTHREVKGSGGRRNYPRFERDGDKLVKLGWSKKNREQYEHRAPRPTVVAVVQQMASVLKPGRVFEVESLLPVKDSSGEEVPGYQVYLTIAWLRALGVVQRKGRDGYLLRKHSLMNGAFDEAWSKVPERNLE